MQEKIVAIENVSKRFRIGHAGRGDTLDRLMDRAFGRRALRETFWALKDISLAIDRGDNFGLVGPNGSGKSTLLKVIASIYKPTSGKVEVRGRVVPFLELGWDLLEREQTGSDNIYYAAALFGQSRRDIDAVFDDIVRFSDLDQYLHTPLKYYSTGMQIRLTFSIALFCHPEIFLVDEILSVGDIAFQRKCYDALKRLQEQQETLVFVSHDLQAMREFCDHGLFLLKGEVLAIGDIDDVIEEYMFGAWAKNTTSEVLDYLESREVHILNVAVRDSSGRDRSTFQPWESVDISIELKADHDVDQVLVYLQANGDNGEYYFGTKALLEGAARPIRGRRTRMTVSIPHIPLLQGKVLFTISATNPSGTRVYDRRSGKDFLWIVNTTSSEGKMDFHPQWRIG